MDEPSLSSAVTSGAVASRRQDRLSPARALEGEIYGYCDYSVATGVAARRRELPHGEGVLIFNLGEPIEIVGGDGAVLRLRAGEAFFAGSHLRPAYSGSGGAQSGIHVYLPLWTLRRLADAPMQTFLDRVAPLDALIGRRARELGEVLGAARDPEARGRALDVALTGWLRASDRLDKRTLAALARLRAEPERDIADIAGEVGWSRKHLAARVRDATGVGPRCFRRLLRFQSLVAAASRARPAPDWARLAIEAGYCDQSHMIREFREFSGVSPTMFHDRRLSDVGPEAG